MRGDDRLNDVRELEIGMLVRIEGNLDSAIASRVSFDETVKGPVDSLNPLTVLGQTVIANAGTVFHETSLTQIAVGDILEICGLRNADDEIFASELRCENDNDTVEIHTPADAKDEATGSVTLLGLTVNSGTGTEFPGFRDEPLFRTQFFSAITT